MLYKTVSDRRGQRDSFHRYTERQHYAIMSFSGLFYMLHLGGDATVRACRACGTVAKLPKKAEELRRREEVIREDVMCLR
ncbi:hypothetical protein HZ326_30382 [Fusarium oxysporum f. sp. albedinis]|nr:hypothetical protein HZ326_30382 [Fusarium oxysporum f. sp. albedinis]